MLEIKDLKCVLGGQTILQIEALDIKDNGLYVFFGPSGCGKTTLLNIIAGLNNEYSGKVSLFRRNYQKMSEKERVAFRASHFSIFFQHNVFIDQLTLSENINLAAINNTKSLTEFNKEKNSKLANVLHIEKLLNHRVKTLSGGEKTRGALARALSKESPIYLFDEPTAALDSKNAINVMELIKAKAERSIVLLVTHDYKLAKKYATTIFTLADGQIINEKSRKNKFATAPSYLPQNLDYKKNDKYIAKSLLKAKKARHFFSGGAVNIGLVGLGLSLLLVNAINTKLVLAFKGNFSEHTTYTASTYTPEINVIKSVNSQTLNNLRPEQVGALYLNDMFMMFPSENTITFSANNKRFTLPSFHAGLFNEALFLSEISDVLYPHINSLADDEIALVLPFDDYKLLQNALRLPYRNSPVDVGNYLLRYDLILTLNVGNASWNYFDEHSFMLKSVFLGQEPQIIMGHPRHVITLFEEKMMLPSSLNLTKVEEYPWVLKRVNFYLTKHYETLLWKTIKWPNYMFFTANRDYFRFIFTKKYLNNRILAFETPPLFNNILRDGFVQKPTFFTFTNGLSFVPELMLLGFANNFFIASNEALIDEVIELDVSDQNVISANFMLRENIVNLALQYNGFGGFNFLNSPQEYALYEIGISRGLAKKIFQKTDVVGTNLYVGALTSLVQSGNDYLKEYAKTVLKIVEVIDDDEISFYHDPLWSYLLFKDVFNVSPFNLHINGVIYEEEGELVAHDEWYLVKSKPYKSFKETINKTLNQLEGFTLVGALSAFLLSALIIFLIVYLLIAETNEQFSGLYLMGYNKEAIQSVVSHYIMRFLGRIILLALGQLFIFSFIIEFVLDAYFLTPFHYVFNVRPYLLVLGFALTLLVLLLAFFKRQMARLDLLLFSKRDL